MLNISSGRGIDHGIVFRGIDLIWDDMPPKKSSFFYALLLNALIVYGHWLNGLKV